MSIIFSYKLTESNIYAHLLYRIHKKDAEKIDGAGFFPVLKKATKIANQELRHSDCCVVVLADPEGVIPEEGIAGRSWGDDYIRITIDPGTSLGLQKAIERYLPGTIAHELHHVRRAKEIGYGETFGEVLVSEGLAQVFQESLYPDVSVSYAHNLTFKELEIARKQATPILKSKDYDHDAWFYGSGDIKRWTGYSLGYEIVKKYITSHPQENAATLVDIEAKKIIGEYFS